MPANLVFRLKIWGARDNGITPRSTPAVLGIVGTVRTGRSKTGYRSIPCVGYFTSHDIDTIIEGTDGF